MKRVNLAPILKNNKALYIAYDQGLEHGPVDFNDSNIDPRSIIRIAQEGKFTAMIFQKGIAEKYEEEIRSSGIPLIVKLNGKTSLFKGEPISKQLCSVKEAIELGAVAVGYTIYIGSAHEAEMFADFERIQEEAHAKGIPVIAWIYPRGKSLQGKSPVELMIYAARVGLELGADMVKIKPEGTLKDIRKAVVAAGRTRVVLAGGAKTSERAFLTASTKLMRTGITGFALGRNIWQHKRPLEITHKIQRIVFR